MALAMVDFSSFAQCSSVDNRHSATAGEIVTFVLSSTWFCQSLFDECNIGRRLSGRASRIDRPQQRLYSSSERDYRARLRLFRQAARILPEEALVSPDIAVPRPNVQASRLHSWVYYSTLALMFAAAALRAVLLFQTSPLFDQILILLAAFLLGCIGSMLLGGRWPLVAVLLIALEIAATLSLALASGADFFIFLFAIPCMQIMQRFSTRETAFVLVLTTVLTLVALMPSSGALFAAGMAVVFFAGTVLLVAYIRATRRASRIEAEQHALVADLQQANERLENYSRQLQDLAAGRERQRLARELHDSVTQTIFSMTLTTQSALLLLDRDRQQLAEQLERLNELTESTLAELQTLISRLAPEEVGGGRFVSDLKEHLEERRRLENLSVSFEVQGNEALGPEEEAGLFRIAQEALNNVVKHSQASEAVLQLHLLQPLWMVIEDHGIGFDTRAAQGKGTVGLESMRERAEEIGWCLEVQSSPGSGTRVRVEKERRGG